MAGLRGPIGKRDEDRIRRNKTEPADVIAISEVPEPPKDLNFGYKAHPLVQDLWDSLFESAQTKLWQPSDWNYARIALFAVDEMLKAPKGIAAMKLQAVDSMLAKLLLTEADRRRLKIEVKKADGEAQIIDAAARFDQILDQQFGNTSEETL